MHPRTRTLSPTRIVALVLVTLALLSLEYVRFATPAGSISVPARAPSGSSAIDLGAPGSIGNLDSVPHEVRYPANEWEYGARAERPPPGRLLAYDPRGDGRAVLVMGADLAAARQIAVIVPGAGWRLDNLLIASPVADRRNPVSYATALLAQARRLDAGASVAVVVWLGYDTPDGIDVAALRSELAEAGGRALARFVAGLPAQATVSLLCHSYGAVVCGTAASGATRDPEARLLPDTAVADLVAIGAPGMDVASRADLPGAATVWAARTADDPVRFVPHVRVAGFGHGPDPTNPRFGARVVGTGAVHGHSDYFASGSESLANLARIVLGRDEEVTLDADGD